MSNDLAGLAKFDLPQFQVFQALTFQHNRMRLGAEKVPGSVQPSILG